jgi:hypothetical protein
MRRNGRAAALWALALYALFQVPVILALDRWHPLSPVCVWQMKWRQLQALASRQPDRSLVIMLGSSRTDGGFRTGWLNAKAAKSGTRLTAYNFGIPAAGPVHEYLYLRDLLDANIRPRLLLVELLVPLLNEPHKGISSEEYFTRADELTASHLLRLSPYWRHPERKIQAWTQARVAPSLVYRHCLFHWARQALGAVPSPLPSLSQYYKDLWGAQEEECVSPEEQERRWVITRQYVGSLQKFRLGEGPVQAVRNLLESCQREHIPVVLVIMPESSEFRSWYPTEVRDTVARLLTEWRTTYGARVVDANAWLSDEDFIDGHHMQGHGAEVFTTRLVEAIRPLLADSGEPTKD